MQLKTVKALSYTHHGDCRLQNVRNLCLFGDDHHGPYGSFSYKRVASRIARRTAYGCNNFFFANFSSKINCK